MAVVQMACQILLLTVFAVSVWGKVRGRTAWSGFVASVRAMGLIPDRMVPAVAILVVAGEAAAVPLLIFPLTVPVGLALATALLTAFTVATLVTLRRKVAAVCRCFGIRGTPFGRRHVARNGLLLSVVALSGISSAFAPPPPPVGGLAVAVAAGLAGAVTLIVFDDIVELFSGSAVEAEPVQKGGA